MATATASVDSMLADALAKMDAIAKRMDALETGEGHKNPIKGDDDDDKKDDATAKKADDDDDDKKDDATAPKTKILDDAKGASSKADAGPLPPKADALKKGDDGELEIKHKGKDVKPDDDDDDKKSDD